MIKFFVKDYKEFTMDRKKLGQMKNNKNIVEQMCKTYQQKDLPKIQSIQIKLNTKQLT